MMQRTLSMTLRMPQRALQKTSKTLLTKKSLFAKSRSTLLLFFCVFLGKSTIQINLNKIEWLYSTSFRLEIHYD